MSRSLVCAAMLCAILLITPQPAYAYIDPGLGSLLFQSAVAGFLAVGAAWIGFKMKIMSFFERWKDKEKVGTKVGTKKSKK